jgi:outer membrane protein assembly factor BamB
MGAGTATRWWRAASLLIAGALVAAACGGGATAKGEWPALANDARNSRFQPDSQITRKNVAQLHQKWMVPTGKSVTSTPVVVGGHVYFADWGGTVWSVRADTGKVAWKTKLPDAISSTPAVVDGRVYIALSPYATRTGTRLVALRASDGKQLWETPFRATAKGAWSSPIVADGLVFVGLAASIGQSEEDATIHGAIAAIDAKSGKLAWQKDTAGTAAGAGIWGSVAYDKDLDAIFVGVGNSFVPSGSPGLAYSIVSMNPRTGAVNWKYTNYQTVTLGRDYDFGSFPNLFERPVANGPDELYVGLGSKNGYYYVIRAKDGKFFRQIQLRKDGGVNGIAGYLPSQHGRTSLIFVPTYQATYDIADNVTCCGKLVAIDPSFGTIKWTARTDGLQIGSVAVAPGIVFVGDNKGNLLGFGTTGGAQLFHTNLGASIESGVTLAAGSLFVATSQGDPAFPAPDIPTAKLGVYAFVP